ncbi:hypothetical protein [Thermus sp.]|uniref:hypothetical protein n=1 Tax=Thermus sp. TaxID=275 RepID=UPI003D0D5163
MGRRLLGFALGLGLALGQGLLGGGQGHSAAVVAGALWAFGWGYDGQLGDGTREGRLRPVRVRLP